MTRVLAVDTSTWLGGLALVESGPNDESCTVAELNMDVRDAHSDHLLGRVDWLLAEAGWGKTSLDVYASTRGPGSFTGIRVGLGTVRGLSLATGRPAVGETTFRALAEAHGPAEGPRLIVMEAGRRELYGARFDAAGSPPERLEEPWLASRVQLAATPAEEPWVVIPGPGTVLESADLPRLARATLAPRSVAAALGRLVLMRDAAKLEAESLAPLYIRPPDAVLKRKRV